MTEMALATARAQYNDSIPPRITAVTTVSGISFKGCGP